jgi:hypothetical protein
MSHRVFLLSEMRRETIIGVSAITCDISVERKCHEAVLQERICLPTGLEGQRLQGFPTNPQRSLRNCPNVN